MSPTHMSARADRRTTTVRRMQPDAVIFDWGGTLTRWHDIDFHAESLALAHAVVESDHELDVHAEALHRANQVVWGRSRDHQQSATVADLFTEAGLAHDPELLATTASSGSRTPRTDPQVAPLFRTLRDRGSRSGCCPTRSGRGSGTRTSSRVTACST